MSSPHADIGWESRLPDSRTPGAAIKMSWKDLLFIHWRVDPDLLQQTLPPGLEVDTFDGAAWVALVPFTMAGTGPTFLPPLPFARNFHECNVRTYVLKDGVPGVWFYSLDAASRIAVFGGRNLWNLNYVNARFEVSKNDTLHEYALTRRDGRGTRIRWRTGEAMPRSEFGSLRHFLTERYNLYAARGDRVWRGAVHHEPWTLREAELLELEDELVAEAGIETIGDPICMAADPVRVRGWMLKRV
ncbi:MAG: hypothetical protein CMJ33_01090 [Phycisphaerae bacterium]|nr:hypothetical protein [Phycisphaerae bacterium]